MIDEQQIVARARALVPLLRRDAAETESGVRLTDEVVAAVRSSGVLRINTPRRAGGYEFGARALLDASTELARGCAATSWVTCIHAGCTFMAALLDERGRAEIWQDDPDVMLAGSFAAQVGAQARRVEGGLVVSGRWRFASGIVHAGWVFAGVPVVDDDDAVVDRAIVFLPTSEITVGYDWDNVGMRGTGSHSFVADGVFVPQHRILAFAVLNERHGSIYADEKLYTSTFLSFIAATAVGPFLGLAQSAQEHTLEALGKGRAIGPNFYADAADSPSIQALMADATSLIDTAVLHAMRAVDDIDRGAQAGVQLELPARARIRMDVGTAVLRCQEAVQKLLSAGGTASFREGSPVQRIWRDLETAARHTVSSPDLNREIYGRVLLGRTLDFRI